MGIGARGERRARRGGIGVTIRRPAGGDRAASPEWEKLLREGWCSRLEPGEAGEPLVLAALAGKESGQATGLFASRPPCRKDSDPRWATQSASIGKGSLWSIDPEYRHNLIQALKKTPYHPYSPGLVTPFTSSPTSPQAYHSPILWPRSPFFRKNGVLLQVSQGVIQNGACVRSHCLFPVIRPLPISPVGRRPTAIRSALGDYLTPCDYPSHPPSDDLQEDHNYSNAKSPSMPCSSQGPSVSDEDDDIIAVEVGVHRGVKSEPKEVPLDSASVSFLSQHARRRGLPWTKNRLRALGDTLPLKKRRSAASAEKPPLESDDEEMKEAAGSLLHLAGVRACLNNITNRAKAAQKEKEQKEALRN
ncbi:forkhead box protein N3-like [Salvelinus sp. IW2-2015]|uniref:forkhead box protein N3-like n=1 Tax=Salvelinus sp. IW2-2015 TaxID=2691554 RepID=UPI0038D4CE19